MTFSPVVTGTRLSEDEVVGSEDLAHGSGSDGVHGTGLEVDEDSSGDVSEKGRLVSRTSIVLDSFELILMCTYLPPVASL